MKLQDKPIYKRTRQTGTENNNLPEYKLPSRKLHRRKFWSGNT
jgi:hypothetical protein